MSTEMRKFLATDRRDEAGSQSSERMREWRCAGIDGSSPPGRASLSSVAACLTRVVAELVTMRTDNVRHGPGCVNGFCLV